MKLLTCVVPCYNSAAYMEKAVQSLLAGGDEMDILIVDDGSADETGTIADRLTAEYPDIVRVHHQPNAGHGSALNHGIQTARGLFFKVVDSDDRLDTSCLPQMLKRLRTCSESGELPDLIIHDYVYDTPTRQSAFRIAYRDAIPADRLLSWDETGRFHLWNQFMIHSMIYRTALLQEMDYRLPEHTFYEDNLYIYQPLPHTQKILYLPLPLYGYYVGRPDQSINEGMILRRLDQMTGILTDMACSFTLSELNRLSRHLRRYMMNYCAGQLMTVSSLQFIQNTEESHRMNRDMWQRIHDFDPALYRHLRRHPLGFLSCLPGRAGENILIFFYRAGRKLIRLT